MKSVPRSASDMNDTCRSSEVPLAEELHPVGAQTAHLALVLNERWKIRLARGPP